MGQKRGWTSSACSVGTTASVVVFWSTHSLGARLNTTSDTPLHHSRCSKLAHQFIESFLVCGARILVHPSESNQILSCKVCIVTPFDSNIFHSRNDYQKIVSNSSCRAARMTRCWPICNDLCECKSPPGVCPRCHLLRSLQSDVDSA